MGVGGLDRIGGALLESSKDAYDTDASLQPEAGGRRGGSGSTLDRGSESPLLV